MWPFLGKLLGKKSDTVLGIDISSNAVKVLELSRHNDLYRVESYAVASLAPNAIVENDIKDVPAVASAIELALARSGSKITSAATAIPSSTVITKVLQLDATMEDAEMVEHVQLEAARYVPYPLEEVALDFSVLGLAEKEPGKVNVLVVAARNEQTESRAEALREAGLQPKIIDVESYAIERAAQLCVEELPEGGKNKVIAVVDIGAVFTTITVLHNLKTIYNCEEVFGGKQLTEAIQHRYGLTYEQAGTLKKQGHIADDYIQEVLLPYCESIVPLIRRSLQLFFAASRFTEVHAILLAGGGANISGLCDLIKERLATPCFIANPFSNMAVNSHVDAAALNADSTSLMVCCGLALRSFSE